MKIEFTRAEVERIILDHANRIVGLGDPFFPKKGDLFDTVESSGYRNLPDTITVSAITKEEDAAQ
jgi:hypothetical protein